MRIAVCRPQVPFAYGGAEIFTDTLVEQLRARGHEAEIVSVPFKWYPGTQVLTQAFTWRLLDLTESDGRPIDMVVATKFPSYVVRHPEKRVWLVHQFRQAYELDRTALGPVLRERRGPGGAAQGAGSRPGRARRGDAAVRHLRQRRRPARSARRGSSPRCCPIPAQELAYHDDGHGDFVLSVNRLDRAKRVDLLIEAAALEPSLQVVVVGEGPDGDRLRQLAADRGVNGRVRFAGRVDATELADLYATLLRRPTTRRSTRTSASGRTSRSSPASR